MVRNISISSWFDAFKESAVELAMETSRVDSVVCNQAMAKSPFKKLDEERDDEDQLELELERRSSAGATVISRKIQQMRRGAKFGMSCDDISLDVIIISRWISADDAKRKREATSYVNSADDEDQQMKRSAKMKRRRIGYSADKAKRERRSDVVWRFSRWIRS
ncbi:hypothetical protein F511_22144 [Dorcoceras hygrometricum]|uniref:Uncharacterized protein n=1 Tax=Dorcoceras hygrometricum TaxID=472368 RepID=A0A2Z7BAG9_9LAMI|nr:hypothetical protein F511_22144 [Dorcoceras hygrometricum]